jgi:hypothetical protein
VRSASAASASKIDLLALIQKRETRDWLAEKIEFELVVDLSNKEEGFAEAGVQLISTG